MKNSRLLTTTAIFVDKTSLLFGFLEKYKILFPQQNSKTSIFAEYEAVMKNYFKNYETF
ncbi:hypothetical protein QQ020_05805 [Fulvivirgaceae bacterium BMA12]|uniref:Uncharacterized protein n=1 Tax=Agaribacillus aureus TaxID=3051825 RepID=A0ABT8L1C8_9BACT|nr:hypothetical protein [Fulvivirgaceae bacterium BMA12]